MEQLVLGIFQEQLSKVIIGFRKEQVNANLLNGKGEIKDVDLNCSMFNEYIATVCPYIRVEEIHVSRLGFHVTSWTNLRKAPIIVDIGHMTAKIEEPLEILPPEQLRRLQMITESELMQKLAEGFKPFRGSGAYGLLDRIVDNMTIEIESFHIEFQTWGKFKTKRQGLWTPPLLQIQFKNLKVCMVDAEGCEGSPDQVWAHNQGRRDSLLTFKKVAGECKILLVPQNLNKKDRELHELSNMDMEIHIAVERRINDGAVLACQLDVTIPEVDVDINPKDIHSLAHLASGFQYCFAKDRSFQDPLKPLAEGDKASLSSANASVATIERSSSSKILDEVEEVGNGIDYDEMDDEKKSSDGSILEDNRSVTSSPTDDGISENKDTSDASVDDSTAQMPKRDRLKSERSVIILPNDLIIHKSISWTCSIHKLVVWASYPGDEEDGCLEFVVKGCIAEAIWPKTDREHGFYVQMSTSFVSLEERIGPRQRVILLAGMQRNDHLSLHLPSRKPQEIAPDEFFPLFERRCIRDDPIDLRHLFPTQAFGLKTTIDILNQEKDRKNSNRFMVLHEIGGDEIEVILDTDVMLRMTKLMKNEDGEGFDPRWDTGDWSDILTTDMLRKPSEILRLDECLQECTQLFLDENMMISSDLFNVTARFSNVVIRIPSAVQDSLRSCDIIVKCKESTFVVSSDLPRTFLTGRIGNSITGEEKQEDIEKGIIDFPNDPSDVCYRCEQGFSGPATSTFRMQLTPRGFEVNVIPTVPFCKAPEPQKVVSISESTMILCFEGEAPTDNSNEMKITLFLSILIQELILNIDFDILTGATCTLLAHKNRIVAIIDVLDSIFAKSQSEVATFSRNDTPQSLDSEKIEQSFKGRRILTTRHVAKSRETGGLAIIVCLQPKNISLRLWRQNVPLSCPLRDNFKSSGTFTCKDDEGLIEFLNLLDFEVKDLEVGIEFDFHSHSGHRTVMKAYFKRANLRVVDLAKEITEYRSLRQGLSRKDVKDTQRNLITLCTFGDESLPCGLNPSGIAQHFAFRLEAHHKNDAQSWSMAVDISAPSRIFLDIEAVKAVFVLIVEALLLPAWLNDPIMENEALLFPPGTIGAMFCSVTKEVVGDEIFGWKDFDTVEFDTHCDDPMFERLLRSICKKILPIDLQVILLRCEIANLLISIPSENIAGKKENKVVSLLLNKSDIITRFYPVPESQPSEIEQVLACKGTDWSTLINTEKGGFYQCVCSRQSLISIAKENEAMKLETVVNPFEIKFTYAGAEMDLSIGQGISIDDIRLIENVQTRLKSVITLSADCLSEIYDVIGAVMRRGSIVVEESEEKSEETTSDEQVCEKGESSFSKTRYLLQKASDELSIYETNTRDSILTRNIELEKLKIDLFKKERERFGALSLMSSRVAGWVRMGSQHGSGQRVVKKSLLWPFWAVLRKEILVLSRRPGEPKPSDVVSLVNARLRKLDGGNSKQDTKRGFAITESSGMVRYFVTTNAQEYELWTKEISKAIKLFSDSTNLSEELINMETSDIDEDGIDNERGSQRTSVIGTKLSSAFQSARLKGKEISARRQSSQISEELNLDNESSIISNGTQKNPEADGESSGTKVQDTPASKRAEISKKFSEVGLMTKGRLGSAIQSARKKRDEISTRGSSSYAVDNNSEKNSASEGNLVNYSLKPGTKDLKLGDQDTDGTQGLFGPRSGLKLSNKLGSAIQSARMKAKESLQGNEQQSDLLVDDYIKNPQPRSLLDDFTNVVAAEPQRSGMNSAQSSIRSADTVRQEESNRRSSRFSFLKRNDSFEDDALFGGNLLTLKNIYAGEDIGSPSDMSPIDESLKVLKENWFVEVTEIRATTDVTSLKQRPKSTSTLDELNEDTAMVNNPVEYSEIKKENSPADLTTLDSERDVPRFLLKVSKVQHADVAASFEKQWSFGDVLGFYSVATESIEAILIHYHSSSFSGNYVKATSFEKVMVCGRVLGGLLEAGKSFDSIAGFRRYQCESIESFLNSLLECPLPIDALTLVCGTLGIDEPLEEFQSCNGTTSTTPSKDEDGATSGPKEGILGKYEHKSPPQDDRTGHIFNLLTACEAELHQIDSRNTSINTKGCSSSEVLPILYEPLLPPTLTEHIHDSMQQSLTDAMAQRDEAHAQLIGANVMHSNSLERMRRKNEKLEIDSALSHEIARANLKPDLDPLNIGNIANNIFGNKPDDSIKKTQLELDLKIQKVHNAIRNEDGDAEMTQLCSQLASEISTKTSLTLEIERMKKTRELEKKIQLDEKQALQNETRRLRELLEAERQKTATAASEAAHWKELYEECRANSNDLSK